MKPKPFSALNHFTVPCVILYLLCQDSDPRHADRQPIDQTAASGLPCKEKETPAPSFCASVCRTRTLRISTTRILRDLLITLLPASGARPGARLRHFGQRRRNQPGTHRPSVFGPHAGRDTCAAAAVLLVGTRRPPADARAPAASARSA